MKATKYTKRVAITGVAAICLATAAMGAHADGAAVDAPTRTVRYADLDLNTPAGAAVLYRRIKNAAEQVCGDVDSRRLAAAAAARACVDHAVYVSVQSVNSVKLAEEYDARTGVAKKSINVASTR